MKILIVEDEFISRTLLKEMLAPFGECHTAINGEDAVNILRHSYDKPDGRYDLVCLDIMMPGKNGHEVLKELRQIELEKGIDGANTTKVFMVTTLDDSKNIMEALIVGRCEAYLTKPVSRMKLEGQLRTLHLIEQGC
ncbi:MAG: response regulator [Proteobacteria bacterium]|nr:response regulator [Pseudomonadota bacterium]